MQQVPALRPHLPWLIHGGLALALATVTVTLLGFTTVCSVVNQLLYIGFSMIII